MGNLVLCPAVFWQGLALRLRAVREQRLRDGCRWRHRSNGSRLRGMNNVLELKSIFYFKHDNLQNGK
jgi:hypothetical protein